MGAPVTIAVPPVKTDDDLKIAVETCGYAKFFQEIAIKGLLSEHWDEVGTHRDVLHLDPDHDRYIGLEKAGSLIILSARHHGVMVGYMILLFMRHPRDRSAMVMTDDAIYCLPAYRRSMLGPKLMDRAEALAESSGIHFMFFTEKFRRLVQAGNRGGYLKRRGFEPIEIKYAKMIKHPHPEDTQ